MKFKNHIQSQINQREIEPSHDAFERIQARLVNQEKPKINSKVNYKMWSIAAVVVGLLISVTIYFNQENKAQTLMVKQQIKTDDNKLERDIESSTQLNQTKEEQLVVNNSEVKKSAIKSENSTNKVESSIGISSTKIESESVTEPIIENPKILITATNLDTLKVTPKKKANYTDPNMLLYSIENKEALKETNNHKTKVAVIDLNR